MQDFSMSARRVFSSDGLAISREEASQLLARGVAAARLGEQAEALALLEKAAVALPDDADAAYNYGVALQQSGFLSEAAEEWERAASLAPQHEIIWVNLALALGLTKQTEKAHQIYAEALARHPTSRDLLYNCANLFFKTGQPRESLQTYRALLSLYPNDAEALINAGKTAKTLNLLPEAETFYQKALTVAPSDLVPLTHFNRATLLLLQGKWREGFESYEWRLKTPEALPAPWGLSPFTPDLPQGSRLLLWSDQGLGDAIMFLRFAPLLTEKGYDLFLFAQTPLVPLLKKLPYVKGVFSPHDKPVRMDACLALGSLPHVLKIDPSLFQNTPYLPSPQRGPKTKTKRVGLVWAGNPKHDNDAHRSLSLRELAPLFAAPNIEWISLQLGEKARELAAAPFKNKVRDAAPELTDLARTVEIMSSLDLLISVDTAPAHLAGAIGLPVWTLLPAFNSDWRWGQKGTESFWYPSMRLFRQKRIGAWDETIEELCASLSA